MHGIVVAAHGSRSPQADKTMHYIMAKVYEQLPDIPIRMGYLGCGSPSIMEALEYLRKTGVNRITVVPYFLFQGIHIQETIPDILTQYKEQHPEVQTDIGQVLGEDERLAAVLSEHIRDVFSTIC